MNRAGQKYAALIAARERNAERISRGVGPDTIIDPALAAMVRLFSPWSKPANNSEARPHFDGRFQPANDREGR